MAAQHSILKGARAPSLETTERVRNEYNKSRSAANRDKLWQVIRATREKLIEVTQVHKGLVIDQFEYPGSRLERVKNLEFDEETGHYSRLWAPPSKEYSEELVGAVATGLRVEPTLFERLPRSNFPFELNFRVEGTEHRCALAAIEAHLIN